jgi:hypothetical protein
MHAQFAQISAPASLPQPCTGGEYDALQLETVRAYTVLACTPMRPVRRIRHSAIHPNCDRGFEHQTPARDTAGDAARPHAPAASRARKGEALLAQGLKRDLMPQARGAVFRFDAFARR